MDFRFDNEAFAELRERVEGIRKRAEDLRPVLKTAAKELHRINQKSFAEQRSPLGHQWPAVKPATLKRRNRNKSKGALVDTGALKRGVFAQAEKKTVVFGVTGTAKRYAGTHVFGRAPVPQRSPLPIDGSGRVSFASGDAKAWFIKTRDRVLRWILHAKK